jgi:hypothetical protein
MVAKMRELIYCKDCGKSKSWRRNPARDLKGAVTGEVLWESWVCSTNGCNNKTLVRVGSK